MAAVFVAAQVVGPLHETVGYEPRRPHVHDAQRRAHAATLGPPVVAHLERTDLADDLTTARDFDLGITGPPMSFNLIFISDGLVGLVVGFASAIVLAVYGWWQAIALVLAWMCTHWLLRESAVWQDRNTPGGAAGPAPRRVLVPPRRRPAGGQGGAPVRARRLGASTASRAQRRQLYDLQYEATRLRERPLAGVPGARRSPPTSSCSGRSATAAADGRLDLCRRRRRHAGGGRRQCDRLRRAQLGDRQRRRAGRRRRPAGAGDGGRRRLLATATVRAAAPPPARAVRRSGSRDVSFHYAESPAVLDGFDLEIPAGTSLAIVGQNGAGKTTLAKLLCRLYDPHGGADRGRRHRPPRRPDSAPGAQRVTAVFQDFIRFELSLRENVAPAGAPDETILAALAEAGAGGLADLDTIAGQGLPGRHRPVGRAVAAHRARPRPVRRRRRRRRRAARRADGPARRAWRGRDLRAHPRRHPRPHDDPHLAPLLDRPPCRPHLRPRARRRRRVRHPRRADGARAAATARCSTSRPPASSSSTSTARR